MPVRAVATGFRATATLTGASITAATAVSATLAKTGVGTGMKVAIIPLRAGAKALSGELSRETLGRNCWRGERRAWIEVRGLRSGGDDELGRVVLNAIQAHPGVGSASLNYPLSRVVVAIDDPTHHCANFAALSMTPKKPKDTATQIKPPISWRNHRGACRATACCWRSEL